MATEIIYMIEVADLKARGFIQKNVESEVIATLIHRVQFNIIRPLLGGALYRKLLADIQALEEDATPIPDDYQTLLEDYVLPCLIPYVEMRATTHLNWKMRNKSVGTANDASITAADIQAISNLREEIKIDATEARNMLVRYLKTNSNLYPEYLERNCIDPVPETEESSAGENFMFITGGLTRNRRNERGYKPGE